MRLPVKVKACDACGQQVAKSAVACPHCGHRLKGRLDQKLMLAAKIVAAVLTLCFALAFLLALLTFFGGA